MLSRSSRWTLFLGLVVCLTLAYSQANAQAQGPTPKSSQALARHMSFASDIVYSQPPSSSGGLFQSSLLEPDGSASDEWVWDDFTLSSTRAITEVQWRGAYIPALLGLGGPVIGFTLKIYPTNQTGFEPDVDHPPLVDYTLSDNAGETAADILGGVQTYDYRYALPIPFQAAAGTKYWVQIEGIQQGGVGGVPDWGLSSGLGGDVHHFRKFGNEGRYQTVTGDTAFTLAGPVVPIGNLSATNNSPTRARARRRPSLLPSVPAAASAAPGTSGIRRRAADKLSRMRIPLLAAIPALSQPLIRLAVPLLQRSSPSPMRPSLV